MKTDIRLDITSFLPPVSFFVVVTAFLYPYVKFPISLPVLGLLFILNGGEILLACYLKKKRGFEAFHAWIREFILFQIVFTVLWLFLGGYLIPFGKTPPRPEYLVYYLLVFPIQWLLTLKLRQNMPPDEFHKDDLAEVFVSLRKNRSILLILQFILAMIFLMGFRLAEKLPLLIQSVYWVNLVVNFILIVFINHLLENLEWTGYGIKNKPVFNWFRFPLFLFLFVAVLSLLLAWKIPVLSLTPFFNLLLVMIRRLALLLIKKHPESDAPQQPVERIDLQGTLQDMYLKQEGTGTSKAADTGDLVIRLSIVLLLALFLLMPLIKFLFIGKKQQSALIKQAIKNFLDTIKQFFSRRGKTVSREYALSGIHSTTIKTDIRKESRPKKPRKGSLEALFAELCHWGETRGVIRGPATPPNEYILRLSHISPEKADLLIETGEAFNKYLYDKYPVSARETTMLKKAVRRIIK